MANSRPRIPAERTGWAWAVATCGGLGFLRPGPGTWTSLATALEWLAGSAIFRAHAVAWLGISAGILALSVAAGIPAATVAARESGAEDPGFVTVDEFAGQWLALLFWQVLPLAGVRGVGIEGHALLWQALASFVLFRLFDITKPWPVRRLERLHGGTGILLDDLGAGVFACAVQLAAALLLQRPGAAL